MKAGFSSSTSPRLNSAGNGTSNTNMFSNTNGNNGTGRRVNRQHDNTVNGSTIRNPDAILHGLDELDNDPDYLKKELKRQLESYVGRERGYKARIAELEEEVDNLKSNKVGWMKNDNKMRKLKQIQGEILTNIDLVQDRTAKILQEQERDLLKAFRARLYDVQTELEKEKSKRDDGAAAWIDRCNVLTAELEWSKGVSDRLERINQSLMKENSRLKEEAASHQEDREMIITNLVTLKKENSRLRAEYNALESECNHLRQRMDSEDPKGGAYQINNRTANISEEAEEKFKEINARLKRLLIEERKSLQQLRQTYAGELKSKTELELLLRQCVDDVRKEIAKRKLETGVASTANDISKLYSRQPGLIPIEDFTREDRERTLELLLSQERVLTILYAKTFPITKAIDKERENRETNIALQDPEIFDRTNKVLGTPGDRSTIDKLPMLSTSRPSTSGTNKI